MKPNNINSSVGYLIEHGILRLAELPRHNLINLTDSAYTVSLIEHDYIAKTPTMWNAAYDRFGLNIANVMLVGEPLKLPDILAAFRNDPKYLGGGAGVGFKDEVVTQLDELDPLAEQIGAVNFILKTATGKLKGYNTDGLGYVMSLEHKLVDKGMTLAGQKVIMLGAGGTGNAIAFMLVEHGAQLVILNRNKDKASQLADRINKHFDGVRPSVRAGGEDLIASEVLTAGVIINTSTKGATGEFADYLPLAPAVKGNLSDNLSASQKVLQTIPESAIISDVVLRDGGTPFLQAASELGFDTLDGIGMVVLQGVEAFWLAHGTELLAKGLSREDVAEVMKLAAGY